MQTWARTKVQNDQETAQIAQQSTGIISTETIVRNHPWVKNAQDELDKLAEEKEATEINYDPFNEDKEPIGNTKATEKKDEDS